jgi:hypothetical protein
MEKDTRFKIYTKLNIHLSFSDRIRVLFGKTVNTYTTIETDKEVVVLRSSTRTRVGDFFPKKQKGYGTIINKQPAQ